MLIALVSVAVITTAAGRAVWLLHRLWRVVPRSNRDFGIV